MPPDTPSTTSVIPTASLRRDGGSGLAGRGFGLGVDVLDSQQIGVDLAQRDRQGLLLDTGLEERSDVLEQTFAELGVVGVDLARTLGGVEDQLVLAVRLLQKIVQRRVGDADGSRACRG